MLVRHLILGTADLVQPRVPLLCFLTFSLVAEEVYLRKGVSGENVWDNTTTRHLRPVSLSLVASAH